jgi:hypothetical protein
MGGKRCHYFLAGSTDQQINGMMLVAASKNPEDHEVLKGTGSTGRTKTPMWPGPVSGHDFSRAESIAKSMGLQPLRNDFREPFFRNLFTPCGKTNWII